MKRLVVSALLAAVALTAAACGTATPYQPFTTSGLNTGGFADTRISSDRYRVTFQGNSLTDRDTVERYLLFRAAELTVAQGYDWFAIADRHTDRDSRVVRDIAPSPYYGWAPDWYYLGRGQWVAIPRADPFWYDRSYDTRQIDRYQASAEIFLGRGPKPENDPKAFSAQEVMANLGPTLVRPV